MIDVVDERVRSTLIRIPGKFPLSLPRKTTPAHASPSRTLKSKAFRPVNVRLDQDEESFVLVFEFPPSTPRYVNTFQ